MTSFLLRVLKYRILAEKKFSTSVHKTLQVECLKGKSLISISGNEVQDYMQGLITNDMKHLSEGSPCMYAMFLNSKGRVLYDTIVYNINDSKEFFIECDRSALNPLMNHLLMYKVRRKINVKSLDDKYNVWAVCKLCTDNGEVDKNDVKSTVDLLKQSMHKCLVCCDPRTPSLGLRIVAPKETLINIELEKLSNVEFKLRNFYKTLRYQLGIGEGITELPPGNCYPLEANCDYLHGVSFYKGCYIGQELTARTYHTGVIRKRLMPLKFDENLFCDQSDISVFAENGPDKPIGKLRGAEGSLGIGLLRIQEALRASKLKVNGVLSTTNCPHWWPTKLQKNPINAVLANRFMLMSEDTKDDNKKIQWFECHYCHLREIYDVKGKNVPFAKYINFKQESYFLKDPFSEQEKKNILLLGSDCAKCNKQICQSPECSIFFKQRYCHKCAFEDKEHFPEQLKSKIKII